LEGPADMAVEISDLVEEEDIEDEASYDESVSPERYDIASYGADFDVEGIVKRVNRDEIFIPSFQREYVWSLKDASQFIESLLLGLPVPGVFLAKEPDSNRLLVIDGQQRIKTLQFFYNGVFNPKEEDKNGRIFALSGVQPNFDALTYETLGSSDRIALGNSIIHATIVKQESPEDDDTSIYHIFERLNKGGRRLYPQEIRTALYQGRFLDLLKELNDYPKWRVIFGKRSNRLKDQELILRFLALYFDRSAYKKPMEEFLNRFLKRHRSAGAEFCQACEDVFVRTVDTLEGSHLGGAFRPTSAALNAAVLDSVMVGVATRLDRGPITVPNSVLDACAALLEDTDYRSAVIQHTSDEANVATRIQKAIEGFASI
jgi:hypothetical protein